MEIEIVGILVLLLSFLFFLVIGVPIAISIGLSAVATMLVSFEAIPAFSTLAQRMAVSLNSFALLAIPFSYWLGS